MWLFDLAEGLPRGICESPMFADCVVQIGVGFVISGTIEVFNG